MNFGTYGLFLLMCLRNVFYVVWCNYDFNICGDYSKNWRLLCIFLRIFLLHSSQFRNPATRYETMVSSRTLILQIYCSHLTVDILCTQFYSARIAKHMGSDQRLLNIKRHCAPHDEFLEVTFVDFRYSFTVIIRETKFFSYVVSWPIRLHFYRLVCNC